MEDSLRPLRQDEADVRPRWRKWRCVPTAQHWLAPVLVIAALFLWELGVRMGRVSALFFPAPATILYTLWEMLASGQLVVDLRVTLIRLGVGLLVGGSAGLVLGLVMGWSPRLRGVADPLIAAVHPIPKVALLPLVLIIFGIGETSKIVLIALAAFFPMVISTMAGVCQIHPIHFEVARNYGARPSTVLRRVVLPGSLPMVLAGLRLALNTALVITVAVELLTAREGLGATIWLAWETLRTEDLYATLVVIAAMGIVFNLLLHSLATHLAPWHEITPAE